MRSIGRGSHLLFNFLWISKIQKSDAHLRRIFGFTLWSDVSKDQCQIDAAYPEIPPIFKLEKVLTKVTVSNKDIEMERDEKLLKAEK